MKILIAEDDMVSRKVLQRTLEKWEYDVDAVEDGQEALELYRQGGYSILITDWMMPRMDGVQLVENVRAIDSSDYVYIIMLTAKSAKYEFIEAMEAGADDYLTKPFHREELVARIHAIIRRSNGRAQSVVTTGKLSINLDTKTVKADGNTVHLTGKEYQMLELLSLRKGTTLTKEMFLNHLYGGMDEPELKLIDVFIAKLRKKISAATGGDNYIETVWGRGYVLRDPEPVVEAAS